MKTTKLPPRVTRKIAQEADWLYRSLDVNTRREESDRARIVKSLTAVATLSARSRK